MERLPGDHATAAAHVSLRGKKEGQSGADCDSKEAGVFGLFFVLIFLFNFLLLSDG